MEQKKTKERESDSPSTHSNGHWQNLDDASVTTDPENLLGSFQTGRFFSNRSAQKLVMEAKGCGYDIARLL